METRDETSLRVRELSVFLILLHRYLLIVAYKYVCVRARALTSSRANLFQPLDDFARRAVHLFAYASLRIRAKSAELFAQVAVYDRLDWEVGGTEGTVLVAKDWRRLYAQVHLEMGAEIGFIFASKGDKSAERAAESSVDDDLGTAGL